MDNKLKNQTSNFFLEKGDIPASASAHSQQTSN